MVVTADTTFNKEYRLGRTLALLPDCIYNAHATLARIQNFAIVDWSMGGKFKHDFETDGFIVKSLFETR